MKHEDINRIDELEKAGKVGGAEVDPVIGLRPDYINAWMTIGGFAKDPEAFEGFTPEELIAPVTRYEDYVNAQEPAEVAASILEKSNPERVSAVNDLAAEFNADRSRILAEQDWTKLKEYWQRAQNLIIKK